VSGAANRSYDQLFDLAIRKVDEIAPLNVSQAAYEAGQERKLGKDLRTYCWLCQTQKRGMRDLNRKTFHWEHWLPVAEIARSIQAIAQPSKDEVLAALRQTRVVWITKDENTRLDQAKARSTRHDPARAYEDAGIELRYGWEECVNRVPCEWHDNS
jgi:hypothetical protein